MIFTLFLADFLEFYLLTLLQNFTSFLSSHFDEVSWVFIICEQFIMTYFTPLDLELLKKVSTFNMSASMVKFICVIRLITTGI